MCTFVKLEKNKQCMMQIEHKFNSSYEIVLCRLYTEWLYSGLFVCLKYKLYYHPLKAI